MKQLFIQFANSMFKRHETCDAYWEAFYRRWEHIGYYCGKNTFEIPKWVAEISYFTEGELFWCHHKVDEAIQKINSNEYPYVLMSLMNANQFFIEEIIKACPNQKFVIGGYNDKFLSYLGETYKNTTICNTTRETADAIGAKYKFGTDYSLFKGEKTIPRLTMSYGCLNRCKFCIVPHGKITPVPEDVIVQQIKSFEPLNYRLVYLDDKTYGQCSNFSLTGELPKYMGDDKDDFNGFIVQTTSKMLYPTRCDEFVKAKVKVAEIGLESFNDDILKAYNKPSSEQKVIEAIDNCNAVGIYPIVNIIVGLNEETDDTYKRTFDFVMPLLEDEKVIGINPAIYTDYDNEENLGEIDFLQDEKTELHQKWWEIFNKTATNILNVNYNKYKLSKLN